MIRFVVDAQLPPGLADHLNACSFTAEHVNRVGLGPATDIAIWNYASRSSAALITKDADFTDLARRHPSGPQVIWIRIGNITNDALWRAINAALEEIVQSIKAGERVVEVI